MSETTQDLAMQYTGGIPVAFPPSFGDEAREFLIDKLEERDREKEADKETDEPVFASVA